MIVLLVAAIAAQHLEPYAFILGIDGTTTRALEHAATPNLHSIGPVTSVRVHNGWRGADTVSSPGWASVLCGVPPEVHGVLGNDVTGSHRCATFMDAVQWGSPLARPVVYAGFPPLRTLAGRHAAAAFPLPATRRPYAEHVDAAVVRAAVTRLKSMAAAVTFVHLCAVDEAGHNDGFDGSSYVQALEDADARVGELLAAIEARPTRAQERWLVLATTDHGGRGNGHSQGWGDASVSVVWAVSSGEQVHALTDVWGVVVRWMR